jgi:8-oxo-dGTP diphosphatase
MKTIHVVAGVIYNPSKSKVLLAQRGVHQHQGGLWEFPGGKLEPGEVPKKALARELKEELDIIVCSCQPLIKIQHEYSDKSVLLDVWSVYKFNGKPRGLEGQPLQWVELSDLCLYSFPEANKPILKIIQK